MEKFLIIGSGRRVRKSILPALAFLDKKVKVIGVCGRTKKTVRLGDGSQIKTETDLRNVDYSEVDAIVISVTTESVPQVLTTIKNLDIRGKTLFIDTPVVRLGRLKALKGLEKSNEVFILEDFIFLAVYKLIKSLIVENKVGKIKEINLYNSGYNHHALAILKYLTSSNYVIYSSEKKVGGKVSEQQFIFGNGICGRVFYPRDYSKGRVLIVGEKGKIVDYPLSGKFVFHLEHLFDVKGSYLGVRVKETGQLMRSWSRPGETVKTWLPKRASIITQKVHGLSELFKRSLNGERGLGISLVDCVYDHFVCNFINKWGYFWDYKPGFSNISSVQYLIHLIIK